MKVKEVWKLALSRKIQRDGVGFRNCNEKRLQDWCISVNNNDSTFKEKLKLFFPWTDCVDCLEFLNWDELKEFLRSELR